MKKLKKIVKDTHDVGPTDGEIEEGIRDLVQLFLLLSEIDQRDKQHQAKLIDYPKGFCFNDDKQYDCSICHVVMMSDEVWYDDCGQKCLDCQDNLNKKRIPEVVFKNHDSWYSDYNLEYDFGIDKKEARKLIKDGRLIPRYFVNRKGRKYMAVYMKKENKWLK